MAISDCLQVIFSLMKLYISLKFNSFCQYKFVSTNFFSHLLQYLNAKTKCRVKYLNAKTKCWVTPIKPIEKCNISRTWFTINVDVLYAEIFRFPMVNINELVYKNKFCKICNPFDSAPQGDDCSDFWGQV